MTADGDVPGDEPRPAFQRDERSVSGGQDTSMAERLRKRDRALLYQAWTIAIACGVTQSIVLGVQFGNWWASLGFGVFFTPVLARVMLNLLGPNVSRVKSYCQEEGVDPFALDTVGWWRVRLASTGGPVPAEPEVRRAVVAYARFRLAELERTRRRFDLLSLIVIVVSVVLAVTVSGVLGIVAGVALIVWCYVKWQPRRLRRRLELLHQAERW